MLNDLMLEALISLSNVDIADLRDFVFAHTLVLVLVVLAGLVVSDVLMRLRRGHDPRTGFLAKHLGITPEAIIPLAPATALWRDHLHPGASANPLTALPRGAPSLQGSYLVAAHGGFTLVVVHNFEQGIIHNDPTDPALAEAVSGLLHFSGRIMPSRLPLEIEQDAIMRANIVQVLLRRKFGYPGVLKVCTLLRDQCTRAPAPEADATSEGEICARFTFEDQREIRAFLSDVDTPMANQNFEKLRRYFLSWPGRQTPLWRTGLSLLLALGIAAAIVISGQSTISPDLLQLRWN